MSPSEEVPIATDFITAIVQEDSLVITELVPDNITAIAQADDITIVDTTSAISGNAVIPDEIAAIAQEDSITIVQPVADEIVITS